LSGAKGSTIQEQAMLDRNKAVVSRLWDVWHSRAFETLSELVALDHVIHDTVIARPLIGAGGYRELMTIYTTLMPDLRFEILDMIAEGDVVCTRWRAQGTQTGEVLGIMPTHAFDEGTGITWQRVQSDRITETWIERDGLGIVREAESWTIKDIGD